MINLKKLYGLDKPETKCEMLDYLFEEIDNQLSSEEWDEVYKFLDEVNVDQISIQLGVGILSITMPLGSCKSRDSFFKNFESKIKKTESFDRVERLLHGLK